MSDIEFDDHTPKVGGPQSRAGKPWEGQHFEVQPLVPPNVEGICRSASGSEAWDISRCNQRFARGVNAHQSDDARKSYLNLMVEMERLHVAFTDFEQSFPRYQPNTVECVQARVNLLRLRQAFSNLVLSDGKIDFSNELLSSHVSPSSHSARLEWLARDAYCSNPDLLEKVMEIVNVIGKHDKIVAPEVRHDI